MLIVMGWGAIFCYEAIRQAMLDPASLSSIDENLQNMGKEPVLDHQLQKSRKIRDILDDYTYQKESPTYDMDYPDVDPSTNELEGDFARISEYLKQNSHECNNITRPRQTTPLLHGKWHQHESDLHHVYMYSSYYDERQDNGFYPSIRILAIAKTIKEDVYCQVWYPNVLNPVVKKIKIKKNGGGHYLNGTFYEQYYFVCHLDTSYPIPRHVSVVSHPCDKANHLVPIYIPIRAPYEHEFGVCVPVAFWKIDPHRLVEWIEANRYFGVGEINIYHVEMSEETLQILQHFERNDTIVKLHHLPSVPKYERTRGGNKIGSPISLNDCLYRNTYRYRWTIIIDFDELIVPRKHSNYKDMVGHIIAKEKLKNNPPPSLTFRNAYFWTGCGTQKDKPKESIFLRYLKREEPSAYLYASKSILDPRRCISAFNHYCYHRFPMRQKDEKWTIDVDFNVALSHHYRENYKDKKGKNKCDEFKKKGIKDETMLKFKGALTSNVEKQLKILGL